MIGLRLYSLELLSEITDPAGTLLRRLFMVYVIKMYRSPRQQDYGSAGGQRRYVEKDLATLQQALAQQTAEFSHMSQGFDHGLVSVSIYVCLLRNMVSVYMVAASIGGGGPA